MQKTAVMPITKDPAGVRIFSILSSSSMSFFIVPPKWVGNSNQFDSKTFESLMQGKKSRNNF
jgi:hypothetical protein